MGYQEVLDRSKCKGVRRHSIEFRNSALSRYFVMAWLWHKKEGKKFWRKLGTGDWKAVETEAEKFKNNFVLDHLNDVTGPGFPTNRVMEQFGFKSAHGGVVSDTDELTDGDVGKLAASVLERKSRFSVLVIARMSYGLDDLENDDEVHSVGIYRKYTRWYGTKSDTAFVYDPLLGEFEGKGKGQLEALLTALYQHGHGENTFGPGYGAWSF